MRKLMWFALPFGAGCALCRYLLSGTWRIWCAVAVLALGLALGLRKGRRRLRLAVGAVGLAAGMVWFSGYAALYLAPAEALAGSESVMELEVLDFPELTGTGARCTVRAEGLRGKAVFYGDGSLLEREPGDRLTARVKCYSAETLAGEESSYFTSRGVFLRLYGKGEPLSVERGDAGSWRYAPVRLNRWLRETMAALYEPRTGGFLTALLTGERDGLDEQSYSDLSEAGLMHVTAVSGLHCGFLIGLLGLLVFRRQRLTALVGYPALLFYMVMVGCTPSVVRSCIMVGFVLLAPLVGREADTPTSLAASLLVILLANPFAVASVSLQLSFAAVAGLLLAAPRIYAALEGLRPENIGRAAGRVWRFFAGTVSASLGVMVLTAPLSAVYFGAVALVSPLSNLLVLWMAPVLFACALLVTAVAGVLPALGVLSVLPEALARYVLWAAGWLAKLPGHSVAVSGPETALWLVLTYLLLAVCALSRERRRKWALALALSAAFLAVVICLPRRQVAGDRLTVVAVDVGQGSATLPHAGDVTALVDCGSLNSPRAAGTAVAETMALYGWRKLDYVVLTHYHADHAGGLAALLARVEAKEFLLPQLSGGDQAALQEETLALARRYGAGVHYVESRSQTEMGGAQLTVYPPVAEGGTNEEGLTVLCTAGDFDVLITGDMNSSTEKKLVETCALPDIEVLLAGHHGSKYSTSQELLSAVTPEIGVISVGQNTFGHPTREAMERMAGAGMTLYRTDWQGNILIQVPEAGEG